MKKYEVSTLGGRKLVIEATNSQQAKRKACKMLGIKTSDYWCGITTMKAKKVAG